MASLGSLRLLLWSTTLVFYTTDNDDAAPEAEQGSVGPSSAELQPVGRFQKVLPGMDGGVKHEHNLTPEYTQNIYSLIPIIIILTASS